MNSSGKGLSIWTETTRNGTANDCKPRKTVSLLGKKPHPDLLHRNWKNKNKSVSWVLLLLRMWLKQDTTWPVLPMPAWGATDRKYVHTHTSNCSPELPCQNPSFPVFKEKLRYKGSSPGNGSSESGRGDCYIHVELCWSLQQPAWHLPITCWVIIVLWTCPLINLLLLPGARG